MVRKYRFGNPINTEAVIEKIDISEDKSFYFSLDEREKIFSLRLTGDAYIYGLGETVRGINKKGWVYKSFCSDDPNHYEDKNSLYGAHNFFIVEDDKLCVGFFFDFPGTMIFDMGFTDMNTILAKPDYLDLDLYVIEGSSKRDIVKQFRTIIGKSYVAPKWAFGYGQSRWSYMNEDEIRDVVKKYHEAGIPLEMVYLDIDYMERYKDFTINDDAFPDFKEFVEEMKNEGVHLIPIIDAGVKIEKDYSVYEEGVEKGYFCKKENGENLVTAVWPGKTHFPDFLNSKARAWFGEKYKYLIDMGIDGFWNDMNEPAIFYTEDHLKEVFEKIEEYKNVNLDINSFFEFKDLVGNLSNNQSDYERFYHDMDGVKVRHDKVHNLYGYNMTRAAGEAFKKICPDKDILMFSRASYIGMHRYGGVWTGDNKSIWSHLLLNIQQMPALNMSGFLYTGADTGGFGCDCSKDLMLRWLAISIFTPLFRNHAAMGTRRQELYAFDDKTEDFKNLINLRYKFIPFLYEEYLRAVDNDDMMFMPLSFAYDDERSKGVEDQLLIGDSLMIAPVYTQNAKGRMVYLPERMRYLKFRSPDDYDECYLDAGDHYIEVALNEVPVFVRPGHSFVV